MSDCKWVASDQPRVLPDRHVEWCESDGCAGCMPCPDRHCNGQCGGRRHVNEGEQICAYCVGDTRDDLEQVVTLTESLPEEAEHAGVESAAAELMGPSVDPEAWRHQQASAISGRIVPAGCDARDLADVEDWYDHADGDLHPMWVVGMRADEARQALGHEPPDGRASVESEADYLDRHLTELARDEWFEWRQMARHVRKCRARLEDAVRAGDRPEKGAPCLTCGKNLTLEYGARVADDRWRCHTAWCEVEDYTPAQYRAWVEKDARDNATCLTADEMVRRFEKQADGKPLKPSHVRVWGARGQVRKCGTDGRNRTLYDCSDVDRMTTRLAESA